MHFDQYVAGQEIAHRLHFASALDFHNLFGRNDDFFEQIVEAGRFRSLSDRLGNLSFKIGVRVYDVPALRHRSFLTQGSSRREDRPKWWKRLYS